MHMGGRTFLAVVASYPNEFFEIFDFRGQPIMVRKERARRALFKSADQKLSGREEVSFGLLKKEIHCSRSIEVTRPSCPLH